MTTRDQDTAQLRARIERERAELGDTAAELAARLDVPARAKATGRHAAEQARTVAEQARVQGKAALQQAAVYGRSALDTAKVRGTPAIAQARATLAREDLRPALITALVLAVLGMMAVRRGRR